MYGFVANRIKNAGKWTNEDESKRKKWTDITLGIFFL